MHAVESEIIKATAYKARTKFANRQDYLGSILNAVMKLKDEDFDNLSDEAAEWANAAVEARNSKSDELPDFDEVVPGDDTDDDDQAQDDDAADDADDAASDDEEDAQADDDTADDDEDDPSDDEIPAEDDDEASADDEGEPEAPAKKPAKKAAAKPVKEKALKPPPKEKKAAPKRTPKNDEDVVLDKWGCMEGSKNSQALAMFEKGATSKEIKEELGGTYYNILKKQQLLGHTVEKNGAVIRLIHKDAAKNKAVKAAPKKGKK